MTDTATTAVMSSLFWLAATVAAPMAAGPTAGKPAHETMTVRNSTTYGHHVLPIGFCSPAEPAQFGSPESPAMPASGLCSTGNIILRRVTPSGDTLASAGDDGAIQRWDVTGPARTCPPRSRHRHLLA